MTKRIQLQLDAVTSSDGTRCAAECPQTTERRHWCAAQEIERRMRDSERAYPPTCPECGVAECAPDTGIYECGGTYETALASAPHLDGGARALDASEALREARVQGMREGFEIARRWLDDVKSVVSGETLGRAIEAVRKGER